jgi:hypothetical protein
MYMAASKRDWTVPTNMMFGSAATTRTASRIEGLEVSDVEEEDPFALVETSATFSFQSQAANIPPKAKKTVESSKGPVGPRAAAAAPAN